MSQLGFGRVVTTVVCRLIDTCRNVDFTETGDAQSFESAPLYGFLDPIPLSCLTRFRQKKFSDPN
jgi:hypothetical protein